MQAASGATEKYMTEREPGFYWIEDEGLDEGWAPARWDGSLWWGIGSDSPFKDVKGRIGPRIEITG
jgi:hypothetical protein